MNDNILHDYDVMNGNNTLNEENQPTAQETTRVMGAGPEEHTGWQDAVIVPASAESAPLHWLKGEDIQELQSRWNSIQIKFVDEPRASVEQADALVADALARIEKVFADQQSTLDQQWNNHSDVSTEDLRSALKSYRSFFNRLMAL